MEEYSPAGEWSFPSSPGGFQGRDVGDPVGEFTVPSVFKKSPLMHHNNPTDNAATPNTAHQFHHLLNS
jgi:hypothetical protein